MQPPFAVFPIEGPMRADQMRVIHFVEPDQAVEIHREIARTYGGHAGLKDAGMLSSALSQARSQFGGVWLHADLFEMAACYLTHIVRNRPFSEHNRRTGLVTALFFLARHGIFLPKDAPELYDLTVGAAEGRVEKGPAARVLANLAARGGAGGAAK